MDKPAHTPGPWIADFHNEQREGGRFITYVRGGNQLVPIAAVPTGVEGYGRDEGRANARLIAAAPDLLAAVQDGLQALVGVDRLLHEHGMMSGVECPAIATLRTAIAKALGQETTP